MQTRAPRARVRRRCVDHRGRIQGHADARRRAEAVHVAAAGAHSRDVEHDAGCWPGERMLGNRELLVVEAPVSHPSRAAARARDRRAAPRVSRCRGRRRRAASSSCYLVVLLAIGTRARRSSLMSRAAAPDRRAARGPRAHRPGRSRHAGADRRIAPSSSVARRTTVNDMARRLKIARARGDRARAAGARGRARARDPAAPAARRAAARSATTSCTARTARPPRWAATTTTSSTLRRRPRRRSRSPTCRARGSAAAS